MIKIIMLATTYLMAIVVSLFFYAKTIQSFEGYRVGEAKLIEVGLMVFGAALLFWALLLLRKAVGDAYETHKSIKRLELK